MMTTVLNINGDTVVKIRDYKLAPNARLRRMRPSEIWPDHVRQRVYVLAGGGVVDPFSLRSWEPGDDWIVEQEWTLEEYAEHAAVAATQRLDDWAYQQERNGG